MKESEQAQTIAEIRNWVSPGNMVYYPHNIRQFEEVYTKSHNHTIKLLEIVDSQAQKIAASATVIDEMHAHTVTLNALYLQAENKIAEQAKEIERLKAANDMAEKARINSSLNEYYRKSL